MDDKTFEERIKRCLIYCRGRCNRIEFTQNLKEYLDTEKEIIDSTYECILSCVKEKEVKK